MNGMSPLGEGHDLKLDRKRKLGLGSPPMIDPPVMFECLT